MGIEPTRHSFERLIGFEDRGDHQISKRFRIPHVLALFVFERRISRKRIETTPRHQSSQT